MHFDPIPSIAPSKESQQPADAASELLQGGENLQEATRVLGLLSNARRLLILCRLSAAGELSVGELWRETDLSQSALSQHLAKLREAGLVATRRQRQTIFYRIARADVARLLHTLHELYCRPPDTASSDSS